ncbi:hypothetical protein FALBO_13094 [Fusarium albosuccineum]|uniref:Uncharacterized protein n=1 Tax=Fusarium albosuccineum TaxID=1237068 RepID=A0A8H4KZ79_9HYPO|nr:hypothetical protein FALBO_13094 [Fusarium albosuccineum]
MGIHDSRSATGSESQEKQYVDGTPRQNTGKYQLYGLEDRISSLSITDGSQAPRAVSPGIEEAYRSGQALTPPDIEFSEDSDVEDGYWTWHQETQQFRHWDEDNQEWVCFPEIFD